MMTATFPSSPYLGVSIMFGVDIGEPHYVEKDTSSKEECPTRMLLSDGRGVISLLDKIARM